MSLGFGGTSFQTAGRQTGSVTVGFETDGTGTSELATLSLGTQTVQLTGDVYRLAVGSLTAGGTVSLGAIREGGTFAARNVAVTNVASTADALEYMSAYLSACAKAVVDVVLSVEADIELEHRPSPPRQRQPRRILEHLVSESTH